MNGNRAILGLCIEASSNVGVVDVVAGSIFAQWCDAEPRGADDGQVSGLALVLECASLHRG